VPEDLNQSEGPNAQRFGDKDYDEWNENWQYLRLAVSGAFAYRVRLPKGLQFKKVPEIQIEIPAVEMVRSPFKTMLIGGKRRSMGEKLEFAGARKGLKDEHAGDKNVAEVRAAKESYLVETYVPCAFVHSSLLCHHPIINNARYVSFLSSFTFHNFPTMHHHHHTTTTITTTPSARRACTRARTRRKPTTACASDTTGRRRRPKT
jgi:hypothetical protein